MLNAVLNIIVILVVVEIAIIKAVIIDAPTECRMKQTEKQTPCALGAAS